MAYIKPEAPPGWTRTVDFTQLGGHLEKQNRLGVSTFNPKTDISAAQFAGIADMISRMSWTSPACIMRFGSNGTIVKYLSQWGAGTEPSLVWTMDNELLLTFESAYTDSYNVEGSWEISTAIITPHQNLTSCFVEIASANTLHCLFNSTGGFPEFSLMVW